MFYSVSNIPIISSVNFIVDFITVNSEKSVISFVV